MADNSVSHDTGALKRDYCVNALSDPLIRVTLGDSTAATLTLSGVLAASMRDEIASYPALRPHQRHAWHSFLVLLGANAMRCAGLAAPPETEVEWTALLRALTPDHPDDAPWHLVAPSDCPALLQPPIPDGLAALKNSISTPDQLDMLATAKNHDLKQARMAAAQSDEWFFGMLTLQTMEGYGGGAGTLRGISRMNSGSGNRACVCIAPPGGPGAHVRRDVLRLLALRAEKASADGYATSDGLALVWLAPWDGTNALRQSALDEWYIEICRRARLTLHDGVISARTGGSQCARIVPVQGGDTGDPWSPVVVEKDGKTRCLTINELGFTYRKMVDLIWGGSTLPSPMQIIAQTDAAEGLVLLARALARGQSTTDGYHERRVPLSQTARRGLSAATATDPAAEAASRRVELAGAMQGVLRMAVFSLVQGGPKEIAFGHKDSDRKVGPFLASFDQRVDVFFFEDLWREIELDEPEARKRERAAWVRGLLDLAVTILREASTTAPQSSLRHWRAVVQASDLLQGAAHTNKYLRPYLIKETLS